MPKLNFSFFNSFIVRFLGLYSALVFLYFLISNISYFLNEQRDVELEFSKFTYAIASTLAPHIPAEKLTNLKSNDDANGEDFQDIRTILEVAQIANSLDQDQLYILRPTEEADAYQFIVMLQERTFIGSIYRPPDDVKVLYNNAAQGHAQRLPLFTDENGSFISSLAPIKNAKGETVAILEIDRNIGQYLDAVKTNTIYNSSLQLFLLLALSLITYQMYQHLIKQLAKLIRATESIQNNIYDYRVSITTDDEFGLLATALNTAMDALQTQFTLLKFVPTHTKKMIEASLLMHLNVELNNARRMEATIMETDIRGFTALSEHLSPSQTIQLVNEYIEIQANIIIEFDGSIDKYMGDAVLVIFEGEEKEQRALDCGMRIQKAINKLNIERNDQFLVEIGIGISLGEVVLGNMGCEQRMEHTMIGSTVNLAARLCSAARRGEIILQKELAEKISLSHTIESLELKGFSKAVSILRYTKEEILGTANN